MKLAFHLAFKNLIGAGLRTWLNVGILAFTFLIIIFYYGIIDGWNEQAKSATINWEYAQGQYYQKEYDPFDPFTLQHAHATFPADSNLTPILIEQATIYPQGRMLPVLLKGIDVHQKCIELPTQSLLNATTDNIPVMIGSRMAKSMNVALGDVLLLRWRDKNGTFDATQIEIVNIFKTDVPTVDKGQIWISIEKLWQMTGLTNQATILLNKKQNQDLKIENWNFKTQEILLKDITDMIAMKKSSSSIIYILLLTIALLAIFDTQVLSIYRRQKEIGAYISLGMTHKQVVLIFTVEGCMYSIFAISIGCIIGIPLFSYLHQVGMSFPQQDIGIALAEKIYPTFGFPLLFNTSILIILSATIVSFIPSRKISKMNPVDALKGKLL